MSSSPCSTNHDKKSPFLTILLFRRRVYIDLVKRNFFQIKSLRAKKESVMKTRNEDRILTVPQEEVEPLQEEDLEWLEEFRVSLDPDWSVRLDFRVA